MKTLILSFIFLLRTILSSGQIIFESTDISFDTIYMGQSISKTLYFTNNSANSVLVKDVKPSLSSGFYCRLMRGELAPNKQDSIEIGVVTRSYSHSEGVQNITVTFYFDNGTTQVINLKGFIKPALLQFTRSQSSLPLIKNKQYYQFTITNLGDSVIYIDQIVVFERLAHYMTASVDKNKLLKNDTAIITVVIKKEFVQEEFLQTIPKIDMNSEETQESSGLTLQFVVILKDCCRLTSEEIRFNIEYFEYE